MIRKIYFTQIDTRKLKWSHFITASAAFTITN